MNPGEARGNLELLTAIRKDDEAAFRILYERYWKMLFIRACKSVDQQEAKDMVQEIMVSFWNRRHEVSFQHENDLERYLFTALKYRVISYYAYTKTELKKAANFKLPPSWNPEILFEGKEFKMQLDTVIKKMPSRMQLIFRMSRDEQVSIADIAFHLNLSEQTVKNQLTQALKRLRTALHTHYGHSSLQVLCLLATYLSKH